MEFCNSHRGQRLLFRLGGSFLDKAETSTCRVTRALKYQGVKL